MSNGLKNSIDFLNKSTKKKNGFVAPENYFNDFNVKILNQENVSLPKQTPFKTPDAYFESLDEMLFKKIKDDQASMKKVIPLYKRLIKLLPKTAAVALLIIVGYMHTKTKSSIDFDTISTSEIENWYEDGYIDTSEDELIVAFDETDINFENEAFNSIILDYEDIEGYLDNIEESTIINEI
ncbi:MAG TPA: hypothetical protein DDY16_01680 [Tenacibaculum sp.]|nr:hypothetical protein [Tenacibaculum sp.]